MQRREFVTLLGIAAAAWPLVARAQQDQRVRRIGILTALDEAENKARIDPLLKELPRLGWSDGRNIRIRTYDAPDVIRDWMLFGKTPEEARGSIMASALGAGFRQSVWMVADELGFDLDPELRTTHDMAVATAPIDSPIGPIQPGTVAAQRFRWEGLVDGEPVVTAAVNWLMGDADLDPPWVFGPEGERFEVEVTGDPGTLLTFKGLHPHSIEEGLRRNPGIVATAMHCVNAVPYVCAAEPGLLTYLDLPLVAGRAAPTLQKGRGA